ncbi:MAG: LysR family transcriptional regulator [Crocinitomicaceae bacterium]
MNYTLHQLKIFLKVSELESITKASEELFLTQPAVSIQLKKFQDQFSVPLTEVVGRKLFVTDFGKEIAKAAENIINEVNAITYKTAMYQNDLAGRLKLSIVSTGKYVMPFFLTKFMATHQAVDLAMDVTNKSLVVKSLEKNDVDFSLVSVVPDQLKTNQIELLQNKLFLVASPKLKIKKTNVKKSIFEKYPLIYREEGSATRNQMEKFIQSQGIISKKKIELTSNEAVKQALIAGLGCSIMPLIGIRNEIKTGELEIIPMKGLPLVTHWNLIWLKAKKMSPVAKAFANHILEERTNIVEDEFSWFENY